MEIKKDPSSFRFLNILESVLFGFSIFIRIMFQEFTVTKADLIISMVPVACIAFIEMIRFGTGRHTIKQYIIFTFVLCMILFFYKKSLVVSLLFFAALSTIEFPIKQLLKTYFWAILVSSISVGILGFMGIVPLYYQFQNIFTLGFLNPNTLGLYVAILSSIYIYLNWENIGYKTWIVMIFVVIVCGKIIDDNTAVAMIVVMLFANLVFRVAPKLTNTFLVKFLFVIFPLLLTIITFWLGYNYGQNNLVNRINELTSLRPQIWHYYLQNYLIKPFGVQLNFSAQFIVNGQTILDGSYLSFPLEHGWIAFSIFLALVIFAQIRLAKAKNWPLLSFMLILIIAGFSENVLLNYYQSPLLSISIIVLFMSSSPNYFKKVKDGSIKSY